MKRLVVLFMLAAVAGFGQNCDCSKMMKEIIVKVERDYPGFADKVNVNTKEEYDAFTKSLLIKASQTSTFNRCTILLDEWVNYFHDEHLHLTMERNQFWTCKKISDSTVMLRLPSFGYDEKTIIDSLVRTNLKEITSTPNLIIDVRGNAGGIDYSYQCLLPLLYTGPYLSDAVEWYASEGNIKSFEDALATGNIRKGGEEWTKHLVQKMKEHRGSFVLIDPPDTVREDTIYAYPRHVWVIIDDFCGSSCEEFILDAKHSSKVTVFGCNTFGVLDYSNTSPEPVVTQGMYIYMPKTCSTRLPEHPIDNIGIAPDVEINLPYNLNPRDQADSWVVFVKDYLEKKK